MPSVLHRTWFTVCFWEWPRLIAGVCSIGWLTFNLGSDWVVQSIPHHAGLLVLGCQESGALGARGRGELTKTQTAGRAATAVLCVWVGRARAGGPGSGFQRRRARANFNWHRTAGVRPHPSRQVISCQSAVRIGLGAGERLATASPQTLWHSLSEVFVQAAHSRIWMHRSVYLVTSIWREYNTPPVQLPFLLTESFKAGPPEWRSHCEVGSILLHGMGLSIVPCERDVISFVVTLSCPFFKRACWTPAKVLLGSAGEANQIYTFCSVEERPQARRRGPTFWPVNASGAWLFPVHFNIPFFIPDVRFISRQAKCDAFFIVLFILRLAFYLPHSKSWFEAISRALFAECACKTWGTDVWCVVDILGTSKLVFLVSGVPCYRIFVQIVLAISQHVRVRQHPFAFVCSSNSGFKIEGLLVHPLSWARYFWRLWFHRLLLISIRVLLIVHALTGGIFFAQEQAIFVVQQLRLKETEAGVLQVVHAQEFSAVDDLLDVFSAK